MENEPRLNITASGDKPILLGNHIIQLADKTASTFTTRQVEDFLAYCKEIGAARVFYGAVQMFAFKNLQPSFTESHPIAVCNLSKTPILKYLIEHNGTKMDLEAFEEYLRTVRRYLKGDNAVKLLNILDNVQISKVKTVSRQKDHAGNFSYQFSSESGKNDVEFPKQISLFIPIIMGSKQTHEIALDFFFTWSEDDGVPELKFQLRDIELLEKVEEILIAEVKELISASGLWSKFGSYTVIQQTDRWSMEENQLTISQ